MGEDETADRRDAARGDPGDGSGAREPRSSGPSDAAEGAGERTPPDRPRRHRADETLRSESLPGSLRCPHCGEEQSEQFAAFGSAVSVSQYYCRSCHTVFEAFKWR